MKMQLEPGRYVVAVSGGVDSVVLLDLLAKQVKSLKLKVKSTEAVRPKEDFELSALSFELIVAHFDHGIRPDSGEDKRFVEELASKYGLEFVYDEGHLGPSASEAAARNARYDFLRGVLEASDARAIITAHHQDDLLETAIINLIRGTGRRGLTSLQSTDGIVRPLLHVTKKELIAYAKDHNLSWREDPSNQDTRYLRNHIRHKILPRFSTEDRQKLLDIISRLHGLNQQIDGELALLHQSFVRGSTFHMERYGFIMLPHGVAREVTATWLRERGIQSYDKKTLERLVTAAKTYLPGRVTDVNKNWQLAVKADHIELISRNR
jgi:tRNA(Ile)-lysidine synthase